MDSSMKFVCYALFAVIAITTEVYCQNSFDGRNTSRQTAWPNNINSQNTQGSSFISNQPAWAPRSNFSDSWPELNARPIQRPYSYMNNSRIPVYVKSGNKNKTNHQNESTSRSSVTDDELRNFSEELLQRDDNNAYRYITLNVQSKTTSFSKEDVAPQNLMHVSSNVDRISTISKIKRLYDNYIPAVNQNEVVTNEEREEENELLDAILNTSVMEYTRNFLISKGAIGNDPNEFKRILKEIWFTLYSRSKGRVGSSGFEHVFLGELKNNEISGFHNWIYFNNQELNNNVNYLGYLKVLYFGNKGAIVKNHFTFHQTDKPVGSLFIGTSPEFEMALYSTCFLLRADKICPLQLEGKKFIVRPYTYNYNGKRLIGSAFPEI